MDQWRAIYQGPVRDGAFGSRRNGGVVAQCGGCGVLRLAETFCMPGSLYESDGYRTLLDAGLDSASSFMQNDRLQRYTVGVVPSEWLRGATVADVGCGAGSLLDHVRGLTKRQIAIEPCARFRSDLSARGYDAYAYVRDAVRDCMGEVDVAFSTQVIEHTQNPREFLKEVRTLLRAAGRLVLSTPNRHDILMELLGDDYSAFFYRVVHRWYFDARSLAACARLAGFEVEAVRHVHRYGMANTLLWLRDRRPTGNCRVDAIDVVVDELWVSYLERTGRSDCLYVILRPV
jgi:2-polyprenyl-3-methyl-5-hydroxy-6-metoxy-1,4-benzoquinol methylase